MNELNIETQNKAFYWASQFIDELYSCGVRQAVISPGSRSTPLTLAAATHPGIDCKVILDERSAAFTALGAGKATGTPALLICTSGTAAANYFPAVVEARMSGVPLILATADRPPHMRNTGANQAIDQIKLFGNYPVFFHEAGEPVLEKQDLDRLKSLAVQSVEHAKELFGPVHLNFPFRKPLEPDPGFVKTVAVRQESEYRQQAPSTLLLSDTGRTFELPVALHEEFQQSKRPVIIAGPLSPFDPHKEIEAFASGLGAPLLTENGSASSAAIFHFDGFLRNPELRQELEPDLIVRFGFQPTSKALESCFKEWNDCCHIHLPSTHNRDDAVFSATHRLQWNGGALSLPDRPNKARNGSGWREKWKLAEIGFKERRDRVLEETTILTDGHVYAELTRDLPASWHVMYSSSFPVRDALLFGTSNVLSYTNRGASGIDGVTSTAMGIANGAGGPVLLFTGDLAFLHDLNALLNSKILDHPLIIVVLNNGGGTIFRMLPIADHSDLYTRYFETPQDVDISALVKGFKTGYSRVEHPSELKQLDLESLAKKNNESIQVIECVTDPDVSMSVREKLWNPSTS